MGGLDIASAIKVLRDAARGKDFLHKRGIVHRAVKAANLLIEEHDVVKVFDFGVARLKPTPINAAEKLSCYSAEMTAATGTYRWMSPESCKTKMEFECSGWTSKDALAQGAFEMVNHVGSDGV